MVRTSKLKLHDYQIDALDWVLHKHFCGLFLEPGLGKTAIMLSAIKILLDNNLIDKVLIVAPLRVAHLVWPNEIEKWDDFKDLSYTILHGADKDKRIKENSDIYIINPEGLKWLDKKEFSFNGKWHLIVDESSNFKNYSSNRFKILKKLIPHFFRRTILTGTPAPNGLINLWSQIYLLDRGARLKQTISMFRNEYFRQTGYGGYEYELLEDSENRIYEAIDDIVMHKSNNELNLPDKLNNFIHVNMPKPAMIKYKEMKKEFVTQIENNEEPFLSVAVNAAVMVGKLKQFSNGGLYNEQGQAVELHSAKTSAVLELVEELNGNSVLILYEYNHDLVRLTKAFKDMCRSLGGHTQTDDFTTIVNDWNAGKIPVLLLHPAVGGHGLNLQGSGCHNVVWYSLPFDLELYEQANARVFRQGVKNAVTIHHIVTMNTIDERILRILDSKSSVQQALMDHLKK